jgi:dUTP pyrophosphatase
MKVSKNLSVHPPPGTYCQIWSRSGLLTKHGIEAKAGTIDRDYTGDVTIVLYNNSGTPYHIVHSDRIAQLVIP